MDIFLIILAAICLLLALAGSVLPMLPGPPLAYAGILLLHFTDKVQFTCTQLWVWLLLVVVVQALDYVTPMLGTKYFGGTKWGNWGALAGTLLGLFFMPWGILVGPFVGAVAGELLGDKDWRYAFKSGIGSLVGFLLGTVLKLVLCGYFIYQFVSALWGTFSS